MVQLIISRCPAALRASVPASICSMHVKQLDGRLQETPRLLSEGKGGLDCDLGKQI